MTRLYGREFDYVEGLAAKYKALTPDAMNDEMRKMVSADKLTWLVVGDAAKVKPQLEKLGLPIEMRSEAATSDTDSDDN